ncbi:hypothetical protein CN878_14905 [Ochrobactrum sp. 695/2009]|nr:hypothetical protein O206_14945 [Ochrobactrum sp. EGD-AQ16]PJR93174.1 hypothetical protein CN881_06475 [Ochrobactrum sp. 721/2009]PJT15287.1 hypothetical protein CN880_14830 [Ochrobactrum sp. 720/2009]PJT23242.1 hypothetical protein CN879_10275 [Ochrobactrum sp. 715/2009]PJT29065.1 hypothetical protein CN878_14905 [Ochrobactrum sp. 695/2009]PJT32571.1 hypothetical protein CN877_20040 [Ochrobactrum sp. 689/2009]
MRKAIWIAEYCFARLETDKRFALDCVMINDLTDEIFWIFTIGCCILFIMRLLSPPPRHKTDQAQDLNTLRPRRRSRRRRFQALD